MEVRNGYSPSKLGADLLYSPAGGETVSTFYMIFYPFLKYDNYLQTYATVLNTILAMAFHPDVQRRAQEELDRVVGDRLPVIADRELTPYLNALIKEVLRWHPSLPMSKQLSIRSFIEWD